MIDASASWRSPRSRDAARDADARRRTNTERIAEVNLTFFFYYPPKVSHGYSPFKNKKRDLTNIEDWLKRCKARRASSLNLKRRGLEKQLEDVGHVETCGTYINPGRYAHRNGTDT
jgi:hypothetical protein